MRAAGSTRMSDGCGLGGGGMVGAAATSASVWPGAIEQGFGFTAHCASVLAARPSKRLRSGDVQLCCQARFHVLPGQHRLHLMGRASSPRCLFCGHDRDTGFHTLLSCRRSPCPLPAHVNPTLVSFARTLNLMATLRHNAAVHLIADAFRKQSKEGGSTLLVNAGKAPPPVEQLTYVDDALLPDRDTITVRGRSSGQDNTVPAYLLPDYPGRPDLMLLRGWCTPDRSSPPTPNPADGQPPVLAPIEVCYAQDDCVDFMFAAIERKWRKYQGLPELSAHHAPAAPSRLLGRDLLSELRARGWQVLGQHADGRIGVDGPYIITIALGATGQQLCSTRQVLLAMGFSASAADQTMHSLARLSIRESAKILRAKLRWQRTPTAPSPLSGSPPASSSTSGPTPVRASPAPVPSAPAAHLPRRQRRPTARRPAERTFLRLTSTAARLTARSLVTRSAAPPLGPAPLPRPPSSAPTTRRPALPAPD